jgi:hypothetical protein
MKTTPQTILSLIFVSSLLVMIQTLSAADLAVGEVKNGIKTKMTLEDNNQQPKQE